MIRRLIILLLIVSWLAEISAKHIKFTYLIDEQFEKEFFDLVDNSNEVCSILQSNGRNNNADDNLP